MIDLIKKKIRRFCPQSLLDYYTYIKSTKRQSNYNNVILEQTFNKIIRTNHWAGMQSISGTGSDLTQTETLRQALPILFQDYNIKSILDIPCGDFYWMKEVDLSGISYNGADIVQDIIDMNTKYSKENIKFEKLDLTKDLLPTSDLIICRDCFVHLSFGDIYRTMKNIILSGSEYLFTTTFTNRELNYNIVSGGWRTLNLERHPFYFSKPILTINENCNEAHGQYRDKTMGLWKIKNITLPKKVYRKQIFFRISKLKLEKDF